MPSTNEGYTGTITYSSSDASIASVDPVTGEVTINSVGSGSVILTANLASDGNYNSTTITTTLLIDKANQAILVSDLPGIKPLKDFSVISVRASSTSGAPVYANISNGSAANLREPGSARVKYLLPVMNFLVLTPQVLLLPNLFNFTLLALIQLIIPITTLHH